MEGSYSKFGKTSDRLGYNRVLAWGWGEWCLLPYMGYIGMCGPKGDGFSAVLVINGESILANCGHFGHD